MVCQRIFFYKISKLTTTYKMLIFIAANMWSLSKALNVMAPNISGFTVPFEGQGNIFEWRADQRIDLCRRVSSSPPPPGIYRCDIPISSGEQLSVHVGVNGGNDGGNKIIEHCCKKTVRSE